MPRKDCNSEATWEADDRIGAEGAVVPEYAAWHQAELSPDGHVVRRQLPGLIPALGWEPTTWAVGVEVGFGPRAL
jgi:hypothetical protein